jgi:hypothetical protein
MVTTAPAPPRPASTRGPRDVRPVTNGGSPGSSGRDLGGRKLPRAAWHQSGGQLDAAAFSPVSADLGEGELRRLAAQPVRILRDDRDARVDDLARRDIVEPDDSHVVLAGKFAHG